MTDREKLTAFRAEIERLKDSCASPVVICNTLLSFINSMQEEPVDYLTHSVTKISDQEESEWFKELQDKLNSLSKEKFEKLLAKYDKYDEVKGPASEDLEKAATRAAYHQYQNIESDYISENEKNKFIEGAKWKKEQMMKDAVEGKILRASLKNDEFRIVSDKIQNDNLKVGDKVKIIVIKED